MAAKAGGSGARGRRRSKDQAMAAQLRGITRDFGRCPLCNRIVKNGTHPNFTDCVRRGD